MNGLLPGSGGRAAAVPVAVAVALPLAFARVELWLAALALPVSAVLLFLALVLGRDAARRAGQATHAATVLAHLAHSSTRREDRTERRAAA